LSLLSEIENDGSLAPVWEVIKLGVCEALWDEFKEAYTNHRNDSRLQALIDNGQYLEAFNLSVLKAQIQTSKGYKAYLGSQMRRNHAEQTIVMRLAQNSLYSNRSTSAEAQVKFDKQYGLIIRP
jgi:hypothetical protein